MEQTPYTPLSFEENKPSFGHLVCESSANGWSLRPVDHANICLHCQCIVKHLQHYIFVSDFDDSLYKIITVPQSFESQLDIGSKRTEQPPHRFQNILRVTLNSIVRCGYAVVQISLHLIERISRKLNL